MENILNWGVVMFGLLAAGFWLWSAMVKVKNIKQEPDESGFTPVAITIDGADLA